MTKDNLRWTVTKLYGYRNRRPSTCSYFINLMVIVQGKRICFRSIGFFKEFFGNLTYKVFRMKLLCAIYFHFFGSALNVLITVKLRRLLFYNNLNRFSRCFIHTIPRADRTCKDTALTLSSRIRIIQYCWSRSRSRNRQNVRILRSAFCTAVGSLITIAVIRNTWNIGALTLNIVNNTRIIRGFCLNAKVFIAIYHNARRVVSLIRRYWLNEVRSTAYIRCFFNLKLWCCCVDYFERTC